MSGIIEKAQETLGRAAGEAGKTMQVLNENDKLKQMRSETRDPSKAQFTSNTGMGVSNTDVWLKVAGERQGPALMEDHHAREKVCYERTV